MRFYKISLILNGPVFGEQVTLSIAALHHYGGLDSGILYRLHAKSRRWLDVYRPAPGGNYLSCRHCYNLSYESRNEPRFARPGGIGYPIEAERLYEELYKNTKRWTYRGRPTKKTRRLRILERTMEGVIDAYEALLKG